MLYRCLHPGIARTCLGEAHIEELDVAFELLELSIAAGWQAGSAGAGPPQGGVVSPLIANLFLHYTFDMWMQREFPSIPFERYADDAACHCRTEAQAKYLRTRLERRLAECRLELHQEKTKIVYCKDDNRAGDYPHTQFDFLGYTFRSRLL